MDEKVFEGVKVYKSLGVIDFSKVYSPDSVSLEDYVISDVNLGSLSYGGKAILVLGLEKDNRDFYYGLIGSQVYDPFLKEFGVDVASSNSSHNLDSLLGKPVVGLINKTTGSFEGLIVKNISDYLND